MIDPQVEDNFCELVGHRSGNH